MTLTRTTRRLVTLNAAAVVDGLGELLPAGVHEVETDEELLQGLSFTAYRRVRSYIRLAGEAGESRVLVMNPAALDAALDRDLAMTAAPGGEGRFRPHGLIGPE